MVEALRIVAYILRLLPELACNWTITWLVTDPADGGVRSWTTEVFPVGPDRAYFS